MKLTFTCPETKKLFSSEHYSLLTDHAITETSGGQRTLEGTVELTSACPFCGKNHLFQVGEILCPLAKGNK